MDMGWSHWPSLDQKMKIVVLILIFSISSTSSLATVLPSLEPLEKRMIAHIVLIVLVIPRGGWDLLGWQPVDLRKAKTSDERGKKIAKAYREAQRRAMLTTEQREAEDRKAKEKKERARQKALQKLTPEDRVALGL